MELGRLLVNLCVLGTVYPVLFFIDCNTYIVERVTTLRRQQSLLAGMGAALLEVSSLSVILMLIPDWVTAEVSGPHGLLSRLLIEPPIPVSLSVFEITLKIILSMLSIVVNATILAFLVLHFLYSRIIPIGTIAILALVFGV